MRPIRKLYFQNASGQRWGLNGENGVYASNLAGFGFTLDTEFADLNRGFFAPISNEKEPQNTLAFTLTFTKTPYDTHKALMDWLAAAGSITIVYNPTNKQEYYRDVAVKFFQKGELTRIGWLETPCSFLCKAPWYLPVPSVVTLRTDAEIKRYTYQYTPDLKYGSDSLLAVSETIPKAGHIPAAIELSYLGQLTNPVIRLTGKISGKVYGVCALEMSFEAADTLKLSTRYENAYVKKICADGREEDLLDALDLSMTPFFRASVEEPCTISIESSSVISGFAELLIYYYFRSV